MAGDCTVKLDCSERSQRKCMSLRVLEKPSPFLTGLFLSYNTENKEQRNVELLRRTPYFDTFPPELVQKMDAKNKAYPDNTLGLLRFIRNLHEHYAKDAAQVDVMALFPDLFGCVYKFAKTQGWNSETPLKEMFQREHFTTSFVMPSTKFEEQLGVPVQESQPSDLKIVEYLTKVGNRKEVENCRNADPELISSLEKCVGDESFKQWKKEFSPELVEKLEGKKKKKPYPDDMLGLLRFIRNLYEHYAEDAAKVDLVSMFPDLFGCAYKFAKSQGWNSEPPLKEMFRTKEFPRHDFTTRAIKTATISDDLSIPVQETQQVFPEETAKYHHAHHQMAFSPELVEKLEGKKKKKPYPDDMLGLLRFIRNLYAHYPEDAAKVDLVSMFPDLFGCAYKFAKSQGWNSEPLLKEMFRTKEFPREDSTARAVKTATDSDEHLGLSVQESQHVSPEEN
ncbi:hypothetical protein E3U43_007388 [Larimichthys crocea]|uniref:Uncharacterized protein n=1 Tax=Larimichthys crocea TaxID=215358 RepID=A0ACD3Q406_LARCR|nr:hypothetical protein E3U43_007388 [Larimichthys crocea]